MSQYAVVAFTDGTLRATVAGPFRSHERAEAVAENYNAASEWSEDDPGIATLLAYVVILERADELIAMADPTEWGVTDPTDGSSDV